MNKEVVVYTLPACGGCIATKKWLEKKGFDYKEIEITQEIVEQKGFNKAPYIEITDFSPSGGSITDGWQGFRPDRLGSVLL